jgi:hypothetical protein
VNSELLDLAEDKVTLPLLAVILALFICVLPTVMLPKFKEPGVTLSIPFVVVAVPLKATVIDGSEAFDAIARLAISLPDFMGENVTDRFAVVPEGRV